MATLSQEEVYYETAPNSNSYSGREVSDSSSSSMFDPPLLQPPQSGAMFPGQDDIFLKWLFDFKSRSIPPLKMAWLGYEYHTEKNEWVPISRSGERVRIMNDSGVNWGISLLESYFNPVFLFTNCSVRNYNFRMRAVSRSILMTLCERHKEFDLLPSNIDRVAEEIESKIAALLSAAINDGIRRFLTTQTHIQETKMYGGQQQGGGIPSIFSRSSPVPGAGGY